MTTVSLLESVAQHETELMTRVAAAEDDAQRIVAQAHADAAALLQADHATLEADIAAKRKAAAEAREQEQLNIANTAEARVREIRGGCEGNISSLVGDIVRQVVPSGQQGSTV